MEDDLLAIKNLRKSGIEDIIAERQEAIGEKKELEGKIAKLSARAFMLMNKFNVKSVTVGSWPVALITDGTTTKFDRDGFLRYLVEKGVNPKLLTKAQQLYTSTEPKKPHIRVGGGRQDAE